MTLDSHKFEQNPGCSAFQTQRFHRCQASWALLPLISFLSPSWLGRVCECACVGMSVSVCTLPFQTCHLSTAPSFWEPQVGLLGSHVDPGPTVPRSASGDVPGCIRKVQAAQHLHISCYLFPLGSYQHGVDLYTWTLRATFIRDLHPAQPLCSQWELDGV